MKRKLPLLVCFCLVVKLSVAQSSANTWKTISSSMWINGSLYSNLKPLQYNQDLNLISFVQPKSPYYLASPQPTSTSAAKHVMVAMISQNWGTTWDSTCIWNNSAHQGVNPQGAVYNPTGNTSIANAYVVAVGGAKTATNATGVWLSSKPLGVYSNSISSASNATLVLNNTPPYSSLGKVDFLQYGFSSTLDGKLRSVGSMVANANLPKNNNGFRGAKLLTGRFSSNAFTWTADTFLPSFNKHSVTNANLAQQTIYMAWNDSGTVGYLWFIGSKLGATGSNVGYQPIVYKTSNSGVSWLQQPEINFNSSQLAQQVLKWLKPVNANTALTIPNFNEREGIDGIVDSENRLHLVSTLISSASSNLDSLLHCHIYSLSSDNESGYLYGHTPGKRPYIFDFILNGNSWNTMLVDSMSSESPGHELLMPGENDHPWAIDPLTMAKPEYGARIQLSKAGNGEFIIYTWAESDTVFTNSVRKWNTMPQVKARCYAICINSLDVEKVNLTNNTSVASKAFMHFTSPNCLHTSIKPWSHWGYQYHFKLPIVVSNSNPLKADSINRHWFTADEIKFEFRNVCNPVSVNEQQANELNSGLFLYPNPVKDRLELSLRNLKEANVTVSDIYGRKLMTFSKVMQHQSLDVSSLKSGIYLVTFDHEGEQIGTKKIVKE